MTKGHYRIISIHKITRLQRALTLCQRTLDLAITGSAFIDESKLEQPIERCLTYFKKELHPYRLSAKELDEMF